MIDWTTMPIGVVSGFMRGERSLSELEAWNGAVIQEFRSAGGLVGGPFEGGSLLLLHHRGRRSGIVRVTPLAYQDLGTSWAVFGTSAGSQQHPSWYLNLESTPEATIEFGDRTVNVVATVARDQERAAIWEAQVIAEPTFAGYERSAGDREIPVVILTPR
jgi:deazaflavin-dependent oxidoreductase (nitroreductase family)